MVELESLAQDMARLEMDRDSCDVVFVVGRDEARVSGHSAVFGVRCAKFVDIVSNNTNNTLASQHQVQSSQSTSQYWVHIHNFRACYQSTSILCPVMDL